MFRNDEIKRTEKQILIKAYIPLHFELFSYIYNTFIVRYKATCLNAKGTYFYSRWAYKQGAYIRNPGGLISGWAYIRNPGGLISGWAYIRNN